MTDNKEVTNQVILTKHKSKRCQNGHIMIDYMHGINGAYTFTLDNSGDQFCSICIKETLLKHIKPLVLTEDP